MKFLSLITAQRQKKLEDIQEAIQVKEETYYIGGEILRITRPRGLKLFQVLHMMLAGFQTMEDQEEAIYSFLIILGMEACQVWMQ